MTWRANVLWPGEAAGPVLRFDAPISFWGGICPNTSRVTLAGHPQLDEMIKDRICVVPDPIGSSSSSAILLELLHQGHAPCAIILGKADAILPIGVVVAAEMGWSQIPVFVMPHPPFHTGQNLSMSRTGEITETV